ncbi:integrin alpha [Myxococcota bacterium]|nr:integrin alpha [Myxococcota bacterium]
MSIPRKKIPQRLALLGWLCLALLTGSTTACNCGGGPPPGPTTIQFVGISQKNFNAQQDEDPQTPGFQLTLRGKTENAPENSKVTLTTNGGNPAEINLTTTEFTFQRYTLAEGANILQLKLTAANGQTYLSDALNVTVDSQCFQIKINKPIAGDVFGPKDDENTETPGLQKTIEVLVEPPPAPGEDVEITLDNGKGSPQTLSAPVLAGKAIFTKTTLPDGDVTLTAKITDKAGNRCQNQIKFQILNTAPTVVIDSPTHNKLLCPPDDLDPQTDGFQLQVDVSTNARDGSDANLLLDGLPFAGPNKVNSGKVSFRVTLTSINALLQHTLKTTVKDPLQNFGESAESKVQIRTRGHDISFANILEGQKIPASRDEDPQTTGVQYTVRATTSAPNGTDIKLLFNGKELIQKANNSVVTFLVTLVENQDNTFQLNAFEPTCNLKTNSPAVKVTVEEQGAPALSCKLIKGPAFDTNNSANLSSADDTDPQAQGVQNGLSCTSDAEVGQPADFTINGQSQTKTLVDAAAGLRNVDFQGITFQEGENKISVKVTKKNQKSTTLQYTVIIDTTAPNAINDLKVEVVDHRKASFKLTWAHSQDTGPSPSGLLRYEARWLKGDGPINDANWAGITNVQQSNIVGTPGQTATLVIDQFRIGQKYTLALRAIDRAGNLSAISNNVSVTAQFKQQTLAAIGPDAGLYGAATAIVGDIDKDGLLDLVVSNPSDTEPNKTRTGAVYIYYGRPASSGSLFPSAPDVTLYGEDSSQRIGQSLVGMGDLNNDGFDDFAVGAPYTNSSKGRVYIVFGGPRNSITTGSIATPSRVVLNGDGLFGFGLAAAGRRGIPDLNSDTRADLVVSAPTEPIPNTTAKGQIYIFFGRSTYPAAPNKLVLNKGDATFEDIRIYNDSLPTATSFATVPRLADLNGDSHADLIVPSFASSRVMIFYGPLLATPTTKEIKSSQATLTIQGTSGSRFGNFVSVVGDVNKDGSPELVIIDTTRVAPQGHTGGAAFLFSGQKLNQRKDLLESDAELIYYGPSGSQISTASAAGDVDNDGYADFMIGNGLSDNPQSNAGSAHFFFGNSFNNLTGGDLNAKADIHWFGSAANVGLGYNSLLGGLDLNGDGFPDLVLVETGTSAKGNLYVVY